MVGEALRFMLEDDYDVLHAETVANAVSRIDVADGPPIDLVLTDCRLPNGNVADILAAADRRSLPVILISGDPSQAEVVGPTRRFLQKPFSQAELLSVLKGPVR